MPSSITGSSSNIPAWDANFAEAKQKEFRNPIYEMLNKVKGMIGMTPQLSNKFQSIKVNAADSLLAKLSDRIESSDTASDEKKHDMLTKAKCIVSYMDGQLALAHTRDKVRSALIIANNKAEHLLTEVHNEHDAHDSSEDYNITTSPLASYPPGRGESVKIQPPPLPPRPKKNAPTTENLTGQKFGEKSTGKREESLSEVFSDPLDAFRVRSASAPDQPHNEVRAKRNPKNPINIENLKKEKALFEEKGARINRDPGQTNQLPNQPPALPPRKPKQQEVPPVILPRSYQVENPELWKASKHNVYEPAQVAQPKDAFDLSYPMGLSNDDF